MAKKLNLKRDESEYLSEQELGTLGAAAATQTCPTVDGCFTHTTTIDCLRPSRIICID